MRYSRKARVVSAGLCPICDEYITNTDCDMGDAIAVVDPIEGQICVFHLSHCSSSRDMAKMVGLHTRVAVLASIFKRPGVPEIPKSVEERINRLNVAREEASNATI